MNSNQQPNKTAGTDDDDSEDKPNPKPSGPGRPDIVPPRPAPPQKAAVAGSQLPNSVCILRD